MIPYISSKFLQMLQSRLMEGVVGKFLDEAFCLRPPPGREAYWPLVRVLGTSIWTFTGLQHATDYYGRASRTRMHHRTSNDHQSSQLAYINSHPNVIVSVLIHPFPTSDFAGANYYFPVFWRYLLTCGSEVSLFYHFDWLRLGPCQGTRLPNPENEWNCHNCRY